MLTLLGLEAGREVNQDRMIDALWGSEPPRTAVKSLHSHVWRLRSALVASELGVEVRRGSLGYCLEMPADAVDTNVVMRLADEGRQHAARGNHTAAVAAFDDALSYWRGPSLGEFADEQSLMGEAARFDELRAAISEERLEARLALGQHSAVIGELELLCAEFPFREPLAALRTLALYRAGRQAEALAVLQDLRNRLRDELGLEASPPLNDLEHAILVQSPSLGWAGDTPTFSSDNALRVMLVDDHPLWRQAVRAILERDGDAVVVAEADDGEAAVATVIEAKPELVLMDLHLPGMGGVETTRRIMETLPDTRVLMLSASEDQADVVDALRAGAYGYVLKTGDGQAVVDAVRRVVAGEAVFSASLSSVVLAELRRPPVG